MLTHFRRCVTRGKLGEQIKAMGVELEQTNIKDYPNSFAATQLPKPLPDIRRILVSFGDNNQLWRIVAYGNSTTTGSSVVSCGVVFKVTTLALKDSLGDQTGGFNVLISLMTYGRLLLEFIILFFIAYAVIRLIMRSRNSYYSTLRILGATKGNTDNILRVELILMMMIAYGVDIAFVVLMNKGIIQELVQKDLTPVTKLLYYLTPLDYSILGGVLLLMSLLIANRYSRHIFTRSAMKAFREGA